MDKNERRMQGRKKLSKLRFLSDRNLVFWFTGAFKEGTGYWKPSSQTTAKKLLKMDSKRHIRQQEKSELRKDLEEHSTQTKGNRYKRLYDYDWNLN